MDTVLLFILPSPLLDHDVTINFNVACELLSYFGDTVFIKYVRGCAVGK